MKRVLFIAYLFPPIANSGTQRPLKFAKYLVEHGWEPIILTAAHFHGHPIDVDLLRECPPGARIVRVPMLNEKIGAAIGSALGNTALGKRFGDAVRWRMQQRRNTPDLFAWWQPTAVRAAMRIFRETGFDAIYATGYPWTSLKVGAEVSKLTGRPFVADFRDLWAGETMFKNERRPYEEELAAERPVVTAAAAVVSTNELMARTFSNMYPEADRDKFIVIHNGFDSADLAVERPERVPGTFRIVYTGVWKDEYNPGTLYTTIDWMRRSAPDALAGVEVIAAGFPPGEAERRGLTKYIREVGHVPHHEAVALMRSADLLYLSYENPDRQWAVPGKLYEYLASGAPVVALTDPDGATGSILRRVGGGVVLSPEDPGELFQVMLNACRDRKCTVPPLNPDALAAFERRNLAGKLAAALDDAASRAQTAAPRSRVPFPAAAMPRLRPR